MYSNFFQLMRYRKFFRKWWYFFQQDKLYHALATVLLIVTACFFIVSVDKQGNCSGTCKSFYARRASAGVIWVFSIFLWMVIFFYLELNSLIEKRELIHLNFVLSTSLCVFVRHLKFCFPAWISNKRKDSWIILIFSIIYF